MRKFIYIILLLACVSIVGGTIFYYLILLPLSGGFGVHLRVTGVREYQPYIAGEDILLEGIITNTGKNSSSFLITASLINPAVRQSESPSRKQPSSTTTATTNLFSWIKFFQKKLTGEEQLSSLIFLDNVGEVLSKNYSLDGGESRRFSFKIKTPEDITPYKISDGRYRAVVNIAVTRPTDLLPRVVYARKYEITLSSAPSPDILKLYAKAPFEQSEEKTHPVRTPIKETVQKSDAGLGEQIENKSLPLKEKTYEEEIVRAGFDVVFPENDWLYYNSTATIGVILKNESSSEETFEIFIKIEPPSSREEEKKVVSKTVALKPQESKRIEFLYKVYPGFPEGEYRFSVWYKTRQATSEEVYTRTLLLIDREPSISIEKMLLNPLKGVPTEIIVRARDDVGIKEVFSIVSVMDDSGTKLYTKNILMTLVSGDERQGLWHCQYVPSRSDRYEFSFVATDTKKHQARIGGFPVKVR